MNYGKTQCVSLAAQAIKKSNMQNFEKQLVDPHGQAPDRPPFNEVPKYFQTGE